jgi:protoheme IX farnesyltransferase
MQRLTKYLELTKPKVTSLNVAVGVTCFALAELPKIDWPALIAFSAVAYLAVGGCGALNSFYDRDLDKLMDRTCRRAIPSGAISPRKALLYGLVLLGTGLLFAYLVFSMLALAMIVMGAVAYLFVYTRWLKRRSRWNVVIGGVSGSFAALSGWAATGNMIGLAPMLVALLDFLWTPGHLWGLAIARVKDYGRASVPMLPVTSGLKIASRYVFSFNVLTFVSSLLLPLLGLTGPVYTTIAVFAGAMLLWKSWSLLKSPSEGQGLRLFMLSVTYLSCIMAALIIDRVFLLGFLPHWLYSISTGLRGCF